MDQPLKERRLHARFRGPVVDRIKAVLRPGCLVSVVDLSAGGALIHAPRPLRPGSRVHLQLIVGDRRYAVVAHVLRCAVAALDARNGAQYRGGLKFESRCTVWEEASAERTPAGPARGPSDEDGGLPEDSCGHG